MANVSLANSHLDEAVDLTSRTTIPAILYTLVFILYYLSFRLSYVQLWDRHGKIKRQTAWTLVLQTVLLICATLDIIVSNRHAQAVYIDNNTLNGGPLGLPATRSVATFLKMDSIVNVVEALLILGVLLWRVWVVWSGTPFVIPLTIGCLFFYLASAGLAISYTAMTWNVDHVSLAETPQAEMIMFMMALAICLASLVFTTSAIIARLVFIRRQHIKLMGQSDVAAQYLGIAAMLIESYALDTLWNTGALISYGLKYTPTTNLFINCTIQIDILTNFLLFYRVLSGRAWNRQTQSRLSTLMWASTEYGTSTCTTPEPRQISIPENDLPVVGFLDSV